MVDLTLHFYILSGGRDDFAMLNRNASAANPIQITASPIELPAKLLDYFLRCNKSNINNYQRNGNVAVPGLFIYSGGNQGWNSLEWRSRKKGLIP